MGGNGYAEAVRNAYGRVDEELVTPEQRLALFMNHSAPSVWQSILVRAPFGYNTMPPIVIVVESIWLSVHASNRLCAQLVIW